MKKHNFSAGPSILNQKVFKESSDAVLELDNIGLSLLEISHRSSEFVSIMNEARELSLEISGLNSVEYTTLFLQGGASMQFLMIAYNFLKTRGGYINSGTWSTKAIKEAKLFGDVSEYASSKDKNFNYIPKDYLITDNPDYLHITTNNTIFGTQFHKLPDYNYPLFADMSSDIFCRKQDYSKFSLIYAGAQKNLGPAGTTMVIIKKSLMNEICREVPSMLNYKVHFEKDSMFNTPPVFAIYTCLLSMRWLKNNGGLEEIEKKNIIKSSLIYEEIDNNEMFTGFASKDDRSIMNVTFNLIDEKYKSAFDNLLRENNISGINGHRSVGGYRASIYNAMEIESIEVLVDTMKKFKKII
ncbi:MAG: 3-phosphoserine/phosphohydroxythreonine transaminase [Bacteroidota bacterium]|nr:3-phosphoserine/phosphohydroxythreonine transaminase [Bacteroidota bacterium]